VTHGLLHTAAVLSACALLTRNVRAAPGDATRLEYARSERAASCPDRTALKAAVSKRLGYDPFFPAARQTIIVEIVDADGELRARMRLIDESGIIVGSRELREKAGQCDELVASLALAVSIALDPSAAMAEARVPPEVEGAERAPVDTPPKPELETVAQEHPAKPGNLGREQVTAPPDGRNALQLAVRSSLLTDIGTAPGVALGWRVGVDLGQSWFRIAAEFWQQLPSSKPLLGGGSARASLLGATLAPCLASATLSGCGLLEFGALQAVGENIENAASHGTFYAAVGGRFEFSPKLTGQLRLLTQVEGLKPLTPVTLRVLGEQVWRSPFLTFAAGIGLRLRFR
jgi:hypothetical protein